jgi:hypothetical protein
MSSYNIYIAQGYNIFYSWSRLILFLHALPVTTLGSKNVNSWTKINKKTHGDPSLWIINMLIFWTTWSLDMKLGNFCIIHSLSKSHERKYKSYNWELKKSCLDKYKVKFMLEVLFHLQGVFHYEFIRVTTVNNNISGMVYCKQHFQKGVLQTT